MKELLMPKIELLRAQFKELVKGIEELNAPLPPGQNYMYSNRGILINQLVETIIQLTILEQVLGEPSTVKAYLREKKYG